MLGQQGKKKWHFYILSNLVLGDIKKLLASVRSIQHFTHEKGEKAKPKNGQSFQNMLFCYLKQP